MEHAAAVRVFDRVADVEEPAEQLPELDAPHRCRATAVGFPPAPSEVELPDRRRQAFAADEPHRVIRTPGRVAAQAVDRDDPRVLQLPGDLGLQDEPRALVLPPREPVLDDLQRHLALQLAVPRHPDLPDPSLGVQPDRLEPLDSRRRRRFPRAVRGPTGHRDRLAEPVVRHRPRGQGLTRADRHPERRRQGRVADLRQDLLRQTHGIPCIQARHAGRSGGGGGGIRPGNGGPGGAPDRSSPRRAGSRRGFSAGPWPRHSGPPRGHDEGSRR